MNFIAQGIILSHVACHNERRKAAERLNKPLEEIPLKFGSVRMAVNRIQFLQEGAEENTTFEIDRSSDDISIREQRLILEISYKFDYRETEVGQSYGPIVEEHDIVNELKVNERYLLKMNHSFVNSKHYMKLINPNGNNAIKSYFLKSWADNITFVAPPELLNGEDNITPKGVIQKFNLNKELVIV